MAVKMKLIYTPEGGSAREWVIDMENPEWDINFATEKATNWPWAEFRDRLMKDSAIATRALLWVLRKRTEQKLALDSVQPNGDEISWEGLCPDCEQWLGEDDVDDDGGHNCPAADADEAEPAAQPEAGESGEA